MRLILLSLFFALLLGASFGAKVHANFGRGLAASDPDDADILALLSRHGFTITRAPPGTDPVWLTGRKGDCAIDIASVSPRGWHRTAVDWRASGGTLRYAAEGGLFDQQPILGPTLIHYLNRLKRYAGIDAPAVKVRAIIIAPECPADAVLMTELAALSE
ncbi:MAG TPA: hypothetical protein VNS34_06540 [Rhizobiaceae bacterium]|nr:hypothetical protein [Rhizobiaceae bacterium]